MASGAGSDFYYRRNRLRCNTRTTNAPAASASGIAVHPAEACALHRAVRDSADQLEPGFMDGVDFEFEEFVVTEAIGLTLHGTDFVIGAL